MMMMMMMMMMNNKKMNKPKHTKDKELSEETKSNDKPNKHEKWASQKHWINNTDRR